MDRFLAKLPCFLQKGNVSQWGNSPLEKTMPNKWFSVKVLFTILLFTINKDNETILFYVTRVFKFCCEMAY